MEAFDAILDESARVDPTTKNILPQSLIEWRSLDRLEKAARGSNPTILDSAPDCIFVHLTEKSS